ncbi:MAG: tetratricopeptide repeat protein [Anaerolineae bacterium]|nr:tetratricopeptide repeat protein [Anaerolineae bacterium]
MNNTLLLIFFGASTVHFGGKASQIIPTFFKLLAALFTGVVKWPGPRIHDPDHNANVVRERLGVRYENLFLTFIFNSSGVFGAFIFSLLMFLSSTSLMSGYVRINWTVTTAILILFALTGGRMGFKKAQRNVVQVNTLLSDLAKKVEPRAVDGCSARSEYAIEHPLIGDRNLPSDRKRALDQFYESVRYHQDGNEFRAMNLYNEATRTDPSLHKNARDVLSEMAQDCSSTDAGAIYYWLGIHSEHLSDWRQAAVAYEKAVNAFNQIGYKNRASRACNNLGSVKMQMRDPSAMDEFEKAIALNPANGMAHISVGVTYYRISERGDPRFEKALDAFANAIIANSLAYTPIVTSRLRSIGYTWKEDLEDVLQRVDSKLLGISSETDIPAQEDEIKANRKKRTGFDTGVPGEKPDESKASRKTKIDFKFSVPVEKTAKLKTYQDEKHGFEIAIPEDWSIYKEAAPMLASVFFRLAHGWTPDVDIAFTCSPNEILNIVVETMTPEPTPNFTERFFRLYAQNMNFTNCEYGRITVGNKAHTWSRYQVKNKIWSKKYMIVLDGKGYAITASCNGKEMFLQREKIWDAIAASFRLLAPC